MTQLLIQGTKVLAKGPFVDIGDSIESRDAIYPKSTMPGWQIANAELPDDFALGRYDFDGANLVLSQAAKDEAETERVAAIKAQIAQLEMENPITLRGIRELVMVVREIVKQLTGSYPDTYGFNRVAEIESQISALRAQL